MPASILAALLLFSPAADLSIPGTDPAALDRLVTSGRGANRVMNHLEDLTETFGARLTGSTSYRLASEWAVRKFKEFGIANARLEEAGTVPVGFDRGKRQVAKIVAPFERVIEFTTDAWTPGTEGPIRGPVVLAPATADELEKAKAGLKGAWVMLEPGTGGRGRTAPGTDALYGAGILGVIAPVSGELITTGGRFAGLTWENLPRNRRIKIKKSDAEAIKAELAKGRTVEMLFDIQNTFVKGPIAFHNVVADIPGSELPDEFVIVGAHFDSWDGPGSVGANDNGTGSSAVLEAARLLVASGVRPKRTIRFILFAAEEQGLIGSRAYVEKHKDEWSKISAVFVDDGGTNYHGGHQCLASQAALLQPIADYMTRAFPSMPQKLQILAATPRGGSSDHAAFTAQGIPGFYTIEAGRADYAHIWHTQNDRVEFTVPEYMVQAATDFAVTAYSIANADRLMPRK